MKVKLYNYGQSFNKNSNYSRGVMKLTISDDLRGDILERLDRLGVNSFSIYPNLEGLSSFLTWKHFKPLS